MLFRSNTGAGPGEAESNRIINQILVEMDGFDANSGVIVVGATNLAENLDPAMLREGRFDRRVTVKLPDKRDRVAILDYYAKRVQVEGNIDFDQIARMTSGFSPATLAYLVNNAALIAARANAERVTMGHLIEAAEVSHMGELNGGQRALTDSEKERIAVHEAGHAIVAAALNCGRVEKVTILPRGGALGVTLVTSAEDKTLHLRTDIEHRIQMLLAGRNAEIAIFGEASSGAAHDLQEASRLALDMVGRFGFADDGNLFSLQSVPARSASQYVDKSIEQANSVLTNMDVMCVALLRQHRDALDALTGMLLEHDTVEGKVVSEILREYASNPTRRDPDIQPVQAPQAMAA